MPEEQRAQDLGLLGFFELVVAAGSGEGKVAADVGVGRIQALRAPVIEDCPADVVHLEIGVAQVVVELSVANSELGGQALVAQHGALIQGAGGFGIVRLHAVGLPEKRVGLVENRRRVLSGRGKQRRQKDDEQASHRSFSSMAAMAVCASAVRPPDEPRAAPA